jgi:non-specific serine/threonine protein kinase
MIGQTISHYIILEKLGEGGMGVVYKAHDTKLDRLVALKFLPQQIAVSVEDKARFLQEAKAISALNHPNIATIHDIDEVDGPAYADASAGKQKFLVLEYIPGGTLKSKLKRLKSEDREFSIGEVLDYGIQAAEALAHAHRHQIVHRDVKTDNLMFTEEGKVKLTDFGLAKLRGSVQVTKTGTTVGTAAYMSPEQIRGEQVDHRSDIFSFGVVLYELLTSHLPFRGEFETALSYSILNENPPPVKSLRKNTPAALESVIDRCLEKEKTKRYHSAEEVVEALREVRQEISPAIKTKKKGGKIPLLVGGALLVVAVIVIAYLFWPERPITAAEKSIAVLPFKNMSDNKEDEYFSDGITEDIIARLSKISHLKVISRTSVMQYKGVAKPLREIGKELGVATILEGSVRRAGNRIRIVGQLIDAISDEHIWADTYDRELKDVFAIQSDVAEQIAAVLEVRLSPRETERIEHKPTENVAAYSYFLRGNSYVSGGYENSRNAIQMYEKAISEDSTFALAYAKLSQAHQYQYWFYIDRTGERLSMAREAAEKAVQLDPGLAEGYVAMGQYFYHGFLDFDKALEFLRAAEEREPNNATALSLIGYVYRRSGEWQRSLPYLTKALEIDPRSASISFNLAITNLQQREFIDAERYFDRSIALSPGWPEPYCLRAWSSLNKEGFTQVTRAHLLTYLKIGEGEQLTTIIPDEQPWWLLRVVDRELQDIVMRMSLKSFGVDTLSYYLTKGFVCRIQHRNDLARAYFDTVRALSTNKIAFEADVARFHSLLGVAFAGLGEKEKALREAEKATRMLPVSKDALWGRTMTENLALVYAMTGEEERAIETLEYLMSIPGMISPRFLEADPIWNSLRSYPRFQKLPAGTN